MARPEDARRTLDDAIGSAKAAITEGRDAIQNLRSGSAVHIDLAQLLATLERSFRRLRILTPRAPFPPESGRPIANLIAGSSGRGLSHWPRDPAKRFHTCARRKDRTRDSVR